MKSNELFTLNPKDLENFVSKYYLMDLILKENRPLLI